MVKAARIVGPMMCKFAEEEKNSCSFRTGFNYASNAYVYKKIIFRKEFFSGFYRLPTKAIP